MGKTYDISKQSDMRKLERDLMREIKHQAKSAIEQDGIETECPHCGAAMQAFAGDTTCPSCGNVTNFTFDWSEF